MRRTTARYLSPGDTLAGSGAVIHQIVTDGLFAHDYTDGKIVACEPRRPFPKGKVEVWVSYPGSGMQRSEWNARTTLTVAS